MSSSAKEHAPEDGELLVTETCRVTRDTNISNVLENCVKYCNFNCAWVGF
jgi:uncharacterized protein YutD